MRGDALVDVSSLGKSHAPPGGGRTIRRPLARVRLKKPPDFKTIPVLVSGKTGRRNDGSKFAIETGKARHGWNPDLCSCCVNCMCCTGAGNRFLPTTSFLHGKSTWRAAAAVLVGHRGKGWSGRLRRADRRRNRRKIRHRMPTEEFGLGCFVVGAVERDPDAGLYMDELWYWRCADRLDHHPARRIHAILSFGALFER